MERWYHQGPWGGLEAYNHPFQHQEDITTNSWLSFVSLWSSLLLDLHWYLLIHLTTMIYCCPCTRTVRDSKMIHQISFIWQSVPLHFAMYPIVDIVTSPPAMNTHSKKCHLLDNHPVNQYFKNGMAILNTWYYFFTLPNILDDHQYIHLVQQKTCLYDLQDLNPEELIEWTKKKKNLARQQKIKRIREPVEKLVWLKRELPLIPKQSRTESGQLGIVWWNQEYWDTGLGLKRLRTMENGIKKEEPSTPLLHIKVKSPPTLSLHYPPSSMSSSHFCSIDPNNFVWSNSLTP